MVAIINILLTQFNNSYNVQFYNLLFYNQNKSVCMHKIKRNPRQKKQNKENLYCLNAQQDGKRLLEIGAKDRLNQLSDITQQLININLKKADLSVLTPWNEDQSNTQQAQTSVEIKTLKKSTSILKRAESKIIQQKKSLILNSRSQSTKKSLLTESNQISIFKTSTEPDQRISSILKSISSRPSNLFPQNILKQADPSCNYTAWKNPRFSLPVNFLKTTRSSHIKVYPSYDTSQTNFNKMILKCKQSTLYLKNPQKQEDKDLTKYIGEHAVFVKSRQRSKLRFR